MLADRTPSRFSRRAGHRCSHDRLGRRHRAGQVVTTLDRAARTGEGMTHAWLFTGPPGSGRSVAARAFAAALQCPSSGCGECRDTGPRWRAQYADVRVPGDRGPVDQGGAGPRAGPGGWAAAPRSGAGGSSSSKTPTGSPSARRCAAQGPPRSRPRGRSGCSCAPSTEDVIITIRSRNPARAAPYAARRGGRGPARPARRRRPRHGPGTAARAAQSHVGLARRLARDEGAGSGAGRHRHGRRDPVGLVTRSGPLMTSRRSPRRSPGGLGRARCRRAGPPHGAVRRRCRGAYPAASTRPRPAQDPGARAKACATRFGRDVIDRALLDLLSVSATRSWST